MEDHILDEDDINVEDEEQKEKLQTVADRVSKWIDLSEFEE